MRSLVSALKSTLLFLSVIILALLCAEIFVRYFIFSSADRSKGAQNLWLSHRNLYSNTLSSNGGPCSLSESLMPSPYLVYTNDSTLPCRPGYINNLGLMDRKNYPMKPDPEIFSIVLVGGSVAAQMANGTGLGPSWLETELNNKYFSLTGKPFRVYAGAFGAWHYPAQITFLSLYGDSMNAVVAIDGYNEAELASFNFPVYTPDTLGFISAMRSLRFPASTIAVLLSADLRHLALSHYIPSKSFFLYGLFQSAVNFSEHYNSAGRDEQIDLGKFFQFPIAWKESEKIEANRKKYYNYIRLLAGTAGAMDLRYFHFVQPNRLIDKSLTAKEKQFAQRSSAELYQKMMVAPSLELATKGFNTFPLTSIYKNENGTIYGDNIHCAFQAGGQNRGYELMAEVMAEKIAKAWHLKKRATSSR
jgi:hypothetical protein